MVAKLFKIGVRMLSLYSHPGIFPAYPVPFHYALCPYLRIRQHGHGFKAAPGLIAGKQLYCVYGSKPAPLHGEILQPAAQLSVHTAVGYAVEPGESGFVVENHRTQRFPVKLSGADCAGKALRYLTEHFLIFLQKLMIYAVTVQYQGAHGFQHFKRRCFAGAGAAEVTPEEEWRRVEAGVAAVRRIAPALPVSVDTFRAEVARRVLETFGPVIVNDISAGELDPAIVDVVAEYDVPYIAMHMRGTPATMQGMTSYRDVVEEVVSYFRLRAEQLRRCGVRRLILDPGFGFAKTLEQNYDLLRGLHNLCSLGYPVLAGVSRKSMIYKVLDTTPDRALAGTIALGWECLRQGAAILRVHDVQEAVDTVRIFKAFRP